MSLSSFMADSWKKCTDSEGMVFTYPPVKRYRWRYNPHRVGYEAGVHVTQFAPSLIPPGKG